MDANARTWILVGGTLVALAAGTGVGQFLRLRRDGSLNPALVDGFNHRVLAWWLMTSVLAAAFLFGAIGTTVVFFFISFGALREFITLTPTRRRDHRALFWVFFVFTPLQYLLIGMGPDQYSFYTILIPVYAFLFIPARTALAGDYKRFLERTAKIQTGLMICVYCLSHAAALMYLRIDGPAGDEDIDGFRLLFFFVLITQLGDVMHYVWQRLAGRTIIAPTISPHRTWESFLGTVGSCSLLGAALWWATPFAPWEAAGMSAVIALMGFAGAITMSAIKRDRGVSDTGMLVTGHGGLLDRIDSICFAAPVFFHLTRFFYADV